MGMGWNVGGRFELEDVCYWGSALESCILSWLLLGSCLLLVRGDLSCPTMPSPPWRIGALGTVIQISSSSLTWFTSGVWITVTQCVIPTESLLESLIFLSCACASCHLYVERHCRRDRKGLEDYIPKPCSLSDRASSRPTLQLEIAKQSLSVAKLILLFFWFTTSMVFCIFQNTSEASNCSVPPVLKPLMVS